MEKYFLRLSIGLRSGILLALACGMFFYPFVKSISYLQDPGLSSDQIPKFTKDWHRKISNGFPGWVSERIRSNRAAKLGIEDISGTEWPMFSAVYYLWATENLQKEWDADALRASEAPNVYAEGAIRAAANLVVDEGNAAWVKEHWGDQYLEKENLFYRMLLISGLLSFQMLLDDRTYEEILRWQAVSLAKELDSSKHGVLDDYPGQCYPVDILPAIAVLAKASKELNLGLEPIIERAVRGFTGNVLDAQTGLPAYIVDAKTGYGVGPSRGVGLSFMLIWAPEVWPDIAQYWFEEYEAQFWQHGWFLAGVREFAKLSGLPNWFLDVDSGPVVAGSGTAASAFGIAAARANGRYEIAYPLSAEALVTSWPLPGGNLMIPRLLSNATDAPLLGEAALLFIFTRMAVISGESVPPPIEVPYFVYLILLLYFVFGLMLCRAAIVPMMKLINTTKVRAKYSTNLQLFLWVMCITLVMIASILGQYRFAVVGLLGIVLLPRVSFE